MSVKVLVVDDHEVVRSGLVSMFEGSDVKIVGEASTPTDAVKLSSKLKPDVVLLDIRLAENDGLDALDKIHREFAQDQGRHAVDLRQPDLRGACRRLGSQRLRAQGTARAKS